jgi:hypothetical protein
MELKLYRFLDYVFHTSGFLGQVYAVSGHGWFHPQDGGYNVPQNTGTLPQHYTVSQPRRPQLEPSLPQKPQISHTLVNFIWIQISVPLNNSSPLHSSFHVTHSI